LSLQSIHKSIKNNMKFLYPLTFSAISVLSVTGYGYRPRRPFRPYRPEQYVSELTTLPDAAKWETCKTHVTSGELVKTERSDQSEPLDQFRIIFILDETGSMSYDRDITISKFNEFLAGQQKSQEDNISRLRAFGAESEDSNTPIKMPKFSLVKFATRLNVMAADDISEAKSLTRETYSPFYMTALLDAIGCTLEAYGEEMFNILVILTDGEENSSKLYTNEQIRDKIRKVTSEKQWEVEYLGANQDAFSVASSMGISRSGGFVQSRRGYGKVYSSINRIVGGKRATQSRNMARYNQRNRG